MTGFSDSHVASCTLTTFFSFSFFFSALLAHVSWSPSCFSFFFSLSLYNCVRMDLCACFCCCLVMLLFFVHFFFLMRVLCLFLVLGSKFHYTCRHTVLRPRSVFPVISALSAFVIEPGYYLFVFRSKAKNMAMLCACTCEIISTLWSRVV